MLKHLSLPPSVEVRKNTNGYLGLFAKVPIERGTKLFTKDMHMFGISGKTVNDLKLVCHNCMGKIRRPSPIMCKQCKVASYCCQDCFEKARKLHAIECEGLVKLEELRGKVTLDIIPKNSRSAWPTDFADYWPPVHVMLAASLINKGILNEYPGDREWLEYTRFTDNVPPIKQKVYSQLEKYVSLLVPESVSIEEIQRVFRILNLNACVYVTPYPGTLLHIVYSLKYSLVNHLCKRNCEDKCDEEATPQCSLEKRCLYTIEDVQAGEQLGVSFIDQNYYMNVREIRRTKLEEFYGLDCRCTVCEGEMIPGSKFWTLERQKSSLITPWTPATARSTMGRAWNTLCEVDDLSSASEIVPLLEASVREQRLVLDKRNVMLILTAMNLIVYYCKLNNDHKAVDTFYKFLAQQGLEAIGEYGTRMDITDITGNMCICLMAVERMLEFTSLFTMTQQIHPRQPSCKELCKMLNIDVPREDIMRMNVDNESTKQMIERRADRAGIPRGEYLDMYRSLLEGMGDRRPSVPQMLETLQHIMAMKRQSGQ